MVGINLYCPRRRSFTASLSFVVVMVMVMVVHGLQSVSRSKRSANVFDLAGAIGGRHLLVKGAV